MLIELAGVSFTYMPTTSLATRAVKDINLCINAGEFVAVIGPTGSGKSTLVQLIDALLLPTRGAVLFNGREVGKQISPDKMRQHVGLVFQFPENQLFEETVAEDIAFGPKNLGLSGREVKVRVREAMELVGLPYDDFAKRSPFGLSGGEKRLAAIAGVLATNPDVLILDEPTSGLDARGKAKLFEILINLNARGVAIVLITHDMDDVAEFARRVVVLDGGQVLFDDSPHAVFANVAELERIGLSIPTAASLVAKLAERGIIGVVSSARLADILPAISSALKEKQCR